MQFLTCPMDHNRFWGTCIGYELQDSSLYFYLRKKEQNQHVHWQRLLNTLTVPKEHKYKVGCEINQNLGNSKGISSGIVRLGSSL